MVSHIHEWEYGCIYIDGIGLGNPWCKHCGAEGTNIGEKGWSNYIKSACPDYCECVKDLNQVPETERDKFRKKYKKDGVKFIE